MLMLAFSLKHHCANLQPHRAVSMAVFILVFPCVSFILAQKQVVLNMLPSRRPHSYSLPCHMNTVLSALTLIVGT